MVSVERIRQIEEGMSPSPYLSTVEEYSERFHALHSAMCHAGYELRNIKKIVRKNHNVEEFNNLIFVKKGRRGRLKTVKINELVLYTMDDDSFLALLSRYDKGGPEIWTF